MRKPTGGVGIKYHKDARHINLPPKSPSFVRALSTGRVGMYTIFLAHNVVIVFINVY